MFTLAAQVMEDNTTEEGVMLIDPTSIFIGMFAIMWAAIELGNSQAYAPDAGKAGSAAKRIYNILDTPTSIDATEMENNKDLIKANAKSF